jgi:hypothetical protein
MFCESCFPPQKSKIGCPLAETSSEMKVLGREDELPKADEDDELDEDELDVVKVGEGKYV